MPGLVDKPLLQPGQTPLRRADQILHRRIGSAHLGQYRFGRHASVHQPDPARLAVLRHDAGEKVLEGGVVRGIARQHLVGERQPFRRHDQCNDHLHAVAAVVTRIPVPTLVAFRKRRIAFEIGTGQVVEQDVERNVEQVAPTPDQMVEQRLFVFEQPIVTAVELVDLRQSDILAQQVGHGAALEPLAMQAPLATRRQKPVGRQEQQHLVPTRPLAARAEPLGPEPVERQFAPQVHRQPAPAPLPRPAQPQLGKLQPDDRGVGQHPLAAVFREQRQGARRRRSFLEDGDRLAPSQFLRIVDLAQVQQRPLHHTASAYPAILHDAPVTVLFAVLLALGVTEKHDAVHDTRGRHAENGLGLHYSRFSPISADRLLFPQLLAGSKIANPAANRPSQASGGRERSLARVARTRYEQVRGTGRAAFAAAAD